VFETLKAALSSLFFCIIVPIIGSVFLYLVLKTPFLAAVFIVSVITPIVYTRAKIEKNAFLAATGEPQITKARQEKALKEYIIMIRNRNPDKPSLLESIARRVRKKNESKPSRRKQ
jgi:hypothetical protein